MLRKLIEYYYARKAYNSLMSYCDLCVQDTTSAEYKAAVTMLDHLRTKL